MTGEQGVCLRPTVDKALGKEPAMLEGAVDETGPGSQHATHLLPGSREG